MLHAAAPHGVSSGSGAPPLRLQQQQQHAPAAPTRPVLPFGLQTLHYPGCGCPPGWQHGQRSASRPADAVDALVSQCHAAVAAGLLAPSRRLRVAYVLPHHNTTGGMKVLVQHVALLQARGHHVIAIHRSDSATSAMPPWTDVRPGADVLCRMHQRLSDVYPVSDIDVVVVGIFHQVAEMLVGVAAPVLAYEQGHEWLFGDPVRLQVAQNYLKQDMVRAVAVACLARWALGLRGWVDVCAAGMERSGVRSAHVPLPLLL